MAKLGAKLAPSTTTAIVNMISALLRFATRGRIISGAMTRGGFTQRLAPPSNTRPASTNWGHGDQRGCRCAECVNAMKDYSRAARERKQAAEYAGSDQTTG